MAAPATRIAGAPISWGINEVKGWGHQMDAARVLEEAASLGLPALESGPEGFLSKDPVEASRMLEGYDLGLVGGFVPVVLHWREGSGGGPFSVGRAGGGFGRAGG